jgi:DNA-binding FadR family transcriptional regulator
MARTKLHEQARRGIERLITDRALKPGSQLPTETDLASELYVSRTTILQRPEGIRTRRQNRTHAPARDDRPAAPFGTVIRP